MSFNVTENLFLCDLVLHLEIEMVAELKCVQSKRTHVISSGIHVLLKVGLTIV